MRFVLRWLALLVLSGLVILAGDRAHERRMQKANPTFELVGSSISKQPTSISGVGTSPR